MGFWDDRLIGQLQGFLKRRQRNLSMSKLPNEYSTNTDQMLRIHVNRSMVVDVAEAELQWVAIAVDVLDGGTLRPVEERKYIPLGHYYSLGTRDVANMLLALIPELGK